ncbi:6-bladed beta-propeller [Bacteroides sp.]|uniref:6-bladed beta-propeller n=1 Tax=Bacteroides sp. TaxID=29523 RepID=UPI002FC7D3C9
MKLTTTFIGMVFFLISCHSYHPNPSGCLTATIRENLSDITTLHLNDEIESVSYIPLEVTADNASLIDGVLNYAVTDKYIYILPVKEARIVLFDRQGRFVKTLIPFGQAPGELNSAISSMQADIKNNKLYLFSANQIFVYTLEGDFIEQFNHNYQSVIQYKTGDDRFASVAFPYTPFEGNSYGIGIFTGKGDTILTKNNFYSSLVSREKSGFTVCMAAAYSDRQNSLLFKTGSNDTIFRISDDSIRAACVLNLQNSDNEVIRALDITDFSTLRGKQGEDRDIFVADLFETSKQYYIRFRHNQGHYVASINKKTAKTLVEKCEQPGTLKEMADANLLHGMLGTKSYRQFPVWGRVLGDELVQVITPYELDLYKDIRSITIPEALRREDNEGNPIFVFYKLKK